MFDLKYDFTKSLFGYVVYNHQTNLIDVITNSPEEFAGLLKNIVHSPYVSNKIARETRKVYNELLVYINMEDYDGLQQNELTYSQIIQNALLDEAIYLYAHMQKTIVESLHKLVSLENLLPLIPVLSDLNNQIILDKNLMYRIKNPHEANLVIKNALHIYWFFNPQTQNINTNFDQQKTQEYSKYLTLHQDQWTKIQAKRKN
ncbi:hypothetical protein OF376_00215 [Ureaplasma miroungigenitalium]|uniref:Uncharacterized protein n=1 Tax=Ureaplasma miroungigenitalium TaxID=1042321 RepID=A0ABT3BLR8_9BACT|nr:hypothetical protein [Ureaplasma miroungigenitalium]MCV3728214.1 hypothetical protein [Ureaplasma miroungigenitalium]MCV3734018.1 hypothetical protein [Ureaplasma miroungigenitalium]